MATTKVVRKKIKRRKKSKMYFGQKTQDAIVLYNSMEPGDPKRNRLFAESIYYPIRKIAENLIHTYKFYYFDEPTEQVIEEVVSNMVINMHKYKQDKGKAFSYFSVVAKNYLILNNNKNYKMGKIHDQIDVMDYNRDTDAESSSANVLDFKLEVFTQMLQYWEDNIFIIKSNGFNGQTWLDRSGNFHSDKLQVTEKYTLIDDHVMDYEATIEDDETFTRPWKIKMKLYRKLGDDAQLQQFKCVEFVEELIYGEWRAK